MDKDSEEKETLPLTWRWR